MQALLLLHAPKVFASGETYTWTSPVAILVSGGSTSRDSTIGFRTSNGTYTNTTSTMFYQKINGAECYVAAHVSFSGTTPGQNLTIAPYDLPALNQAGQTSTPQCDQSAWSTFSGQVTTTNAWPGLNSNQPESAASKILTVQVSYWIGSPPSSITVRYESGMITQTATATMQTTNGQLTSYTNASFVNISPGAYKVCAVVAGKDYCANGTKEKYIPGFTTVTIGSAPQSADQKIVRIHVVGSINLTDPGTAESFGPLNIVLKSKDGTVVDTVPVTLQYDPTNCNQSGTCTGTFNTDELADFSDVNNGEYQACLENTTTCTNLFTKGVGMYESSSPPTNNLTLTQAQLDAVRQGAGGSDNLCGFKNPALNWILCPVTTLMQQAASTLANRVADMLYFPTERIFPTGAVGYKGLHDAWASFRNIALGLVVIAGLFMVISQSLGLEILDAYTIRKLLPRMAVVMIGITLSWPLMNLAITLSNDIGIWAKDLILAPFSDMNVGPVGGGGVLFNGVMVFIGGPAFAAYLYILGFLGALSLLGTILLAIFIGILVLSVRWIVLALAIIIAPLAMASYVLPGTQKLWKFWKDTLISTLMMFPIIMGFLAVGEVMARIATAIQKDNFFFILILFFAPYFMLPFAFKLAGGLMSTLFSLANEKGNGMFGRMRKFRQGSTKQRFGEFASGRRGGENNIIGKGAALATAVSDPSVGLGGILKGSGRQGVYNTRTKRAAAEAIKNAAHGTFDDDYAVKVAEEAEGSMGDDEWTSRYVHLATEAADKDLADGKIDVATRNNRVGQARANALKARRVLEMGSGLKVGTSAMHEAAHHARAVSKTGFTAGRTGVRQAFEEAAAEVSAGRMTSLEAMGILKEAQRLELSSISFGAGAQMIQDIADGGGSMGEKQLNTMLDSSVQFLQPSQLAGARWETVQTIGEHLHTQLKAAFESGDNEKIGQAMADFASFHDSVNYYNPENKKRFEETVLNMKAGTSGMNMREYEEALRVGPPPPPKPEDTPLTPEQQASVDTHAAQAKAFANRRKEFPNRESQENAAILAGQQGMGPPR